METAPTITQKCACPINLPHFHSMSLVQMQSEETTLADSVKLYAEAASLMEYCHAALEKTSLQISEIDAKLAGTVQEES